MSFKYKPNKLKYLSKVNTLDEIHKNYASAFASDKKTLPEKKNLLQDYTNELNLIEKKTDSDREKCSETETQLQDNITRTNIKRKTHLKEQIADLTEKIYDIENNVKELEYYSKTNDILIEYYEDCENKLISSTDCNAVSISDKLVKLNIISQQQRKVKKETKKRVKIVQKPSIDILNYLIAGKTGKSEKRNVDADADVDAEKSFIDLPKPVEKIIHNKASLYDEYLNRIDSSHSRQKKNKLIKMCDDCDIEKTLIQSEGIYVCSNCAQVEFVIIESDVPNHKEPSNDKTRYPYKRLNHLIEWLNQFQAKESTEIPEEIYDQIKDHLKRLRYDTKIKVLQFFKQKKIIKEILQKLRKTCYYEHIPYIISKITGNPPIVLSREVEDKIKVMFRQMQEPFFKFCPADRVNFLNYSYILHKIFVIFGMHDMAKCFQLLKSHEKLRVQDSIWEKICKDLKWTYTASI